METKVKIDEKEYTKAPAKSRFDCSGCVAEKDISLCYRFLDTEGQCYFDTEKKKAAIWEGE